MLRKERGYGVKIDKDYLIHSYNCTELTDGNNGLTYREYFAALAMQGLLSNPDTKVMPKIIAKAAVECADALIFALNEEQPN